MSAVTNPDSHPPEPLRGGRAAGDDEPPHYKVQRLREALAHDRRVGELEINVKIRAGKVLITGTVPSPEVQRAITEVAGEVLPDLEIHNHTTAASYPEGEEVERL
jgi:osmotically-inducible protein OsmY